MRIAGYIGLLVVIVILMVLAVKIGKALSGSSESGVETGSQKAAHQMKEPGEEEMSPNDEIRGAIQDAYKNTDKH